MLGQRGQALAVATQAARQALGDHQRHRAGDVVRRDAHVHQARDGLRRIVGMQRGQHHVAGLRRLDRNLRRFQGADFADHDDVRVLAQERAQRSGKGHAALVVLLHLVDAGQRDVAVVRGPPNGNPHRAAGRRPGYGAAAQLVSRPRS
ncbi:hypothetical protein G6F35_013314 [Rhizopus arrhizus]|nr:hypothetical protein G6F35_013314 [Rhizopus arrhizus]